MDMAENQVINPENQEGGEAAPAQPVQDGRGRKQAPPGMWRQQVQRQLSQQKTVNRGLAAAVVLLGVLLTGSLAWLGVMYGRLGQAEELARQTLRELKEWENDVKAARRTAEEYYASAGVEKGEKIQAEQKDEPKREDYPEIWGRDQVDRPIQRTKRQIRERIRELAEGDELFGEVYRERENYPDKLLEALANNPEMIGFVAGYLNREEELEPVLTETEKKQDFPLFLQWDPRWGYEDYGDGGMIGLSGCGPTCVSMALYYLTGDEEITPDVIARYSMENGHYVSGVGTAWALVEDAAQQYGVSAVQRRISEESLLQSLDRGCVLICSMSKGDFTAAGHFIVIYGYDEDGFLVNDPNCVARSRMRWTWDTLQGQIKNVWALTAQDERQ